MTVSSLIFPSSLKWLKIWDDFLLEQCFRYRLVQWMFYIGSKITRKRREHRDWGIENTFGVVYLSVK